MPNTANARSMHNAVIAQLNAEITTAGHTPTSLAREMGLNYGSFRKYLNGELDMHASMLIDILAALKVTPTDFMKSAEILHSRCLASPKS